MRESPGLVQYGLGYWSSARGAPHSFTQALFVKVTAGFAIFLLAVLIVPLGEKYPRQTPFIGTAIAVGFGITGYYLKEVWREFAIEAAVGVLLLVALELGLRSWFRYLSGKFDEVVKALEEVEELDKKGG